MAALDTLSFVRRLEKAGVPRDQAEAHAEAVLALATDELATKFDIQELRAELRELELRLTGRIDQLDAKIDQVEARLNARTDQLESRMTVRLGGMIAAGIAIVAALVKLP